MKKEISIPILGIIVGELLMFYDQISLGLGIHIVNLLIITFILMFSSLTIKEKNVLQSLTLLIILQMINLSMPQFFTAALVQYSLIYGIMFVPIYFTIKNQQIPYKELGINFSRLYYYLPLAILIGIVTAVVEYHILNPMALIQKIRASDIIFISIVMFIFVGIVEEIIFRSILQTRIEQVLGTGYGILLSGSIFGIMHASFGMLNEILFVTILGIVLGYIFHKTRSLPFIVSIHGATNVVLFGILPNLR